MKYIIALIKRGMSLAYLIMLKIFFRKKIQFHLNEIISSKTKFIIKGKGYISIGEKNGIRRNSVFSIDENGKILTGKHCFFNYGCVIASHDKIEIGNNTKFGPYVMIFDHDYDFKNLDPKKRKKHISSPIIIGNNVWIGAGTIILRGTVIGDNCVVGAGSVLNGKYSPNSIVLQKRCTSIKSIEYN